MISTDGPRDPASPRRICLLGSTGTIGRAVLAALQAGGHEVVCLSRQDMADAAGLKTAFAGGGNDHPAFDAVISCMASRTGTPADAWAVDHRANSLVLAAAKAGRVKQFVLLSAICVQKPLLEFQRAKLTFEAELMRSGLVWSIVRPTAFFKSLSGQIGRVRAGKPFLLFGDGRLTACKPISDGDLARFIAGCLDDETRQNRILPIGGPGPAITPREQGEELFRLLGRPPHFRQVPVAMMDVIIRMLALAGQIVPGLAAKAELAQIGRYYATESMLVWDEAARRYDAGATPEFGSDTLFEHYADVMAGRVAEPVRGDHSVF